MFLRQDLEKMLTELIKNQKTVNMELAQCPLGTLMRTKRYDQISYFHVTTEKGHRIRKSINRCPEVIEALARKKYLETELKILETNIQAISRALSVCCDNTAENIIRNLPAGYLSLPEEYFFNRTSTGFEKNSWMYEPYLQSDYMPEKKLHRTSRGLAVRSKSEVLIAEKLYQFQIPFRYEQILRIQGYELAPDFTLLSADEELFYWEHCGLPGNRQYMKRHKWKLEMYETVGIVPWKNLIITYDNEEGHIDLAVIESEIRNRLL